MARILLGVIAVLAAVGTLWATAVAPVGATYAARGWAETSCVVTDSRLVRTRERDGKNAERHALVVTYTYVADGATRTGHEISFSPFSLSSRPPDLERGATRPCFFDPAEPDQAVLDRSLPWLPVAIGSLGAGLLGVVGAAFLLAAAHRSPRSET